MRCPIYLKKLLLNLAILATEVSLILVAYKAFTHKLTPIVGALSVIGLVTLTWFLIHLSRKSRFRYQHPSMIKTTIAILALLAILAFTGVHPAVEWKDNAIDKITVTWSDWQEGQERNDATEEANEKEIPSTTPPTQEPTITPISNFGIIFNKYREYYNLKPLEFTSDLNRVAKLRLEELQTDFSHYSAGDYNRYLAENICTIPLGFLDNLQVLNLWKNSSGHNANMLNPSYKYTGYANDGRYAVQLFSAYPTLDGEPQLPPGWHYLE